MRLVHLLMCVAAALALAGCKEPAPTAMQGYAEGEYVYLSPAAPGYLEKLAVEQGDHVTSGQLVFVMDADRERAALRESEMKLQQARALLDDARLGKRPSEIAALEAQIKQNEAALLLASKTLERQQKLFNDRVISAEELDRARSDARQRQQQVNQARSDLATAEQGQRTHQVEAAQASVDAQAAAMAQARWNLDQTTRTAPAAALVFDTYFRPGEWVAAGRPVVALLPPERMKVRVFVPEAGLSALNVGAAATIQRDGAGPLAGTVSFISPQAEFTPPVIYSREMRQKLSYMVEISLPPDSARELHPGQPVDVTIEGLRP